MRVLRKNRESRGFSLAELLIVVAIIGILLAVAVPNVLSYYRELKITELDDDARTIFLAAQNQLTALVNSGEKLDGIGETASRLAKAGDPSPKLHYVEYKAADAATTTPTAPSATGLRKILPGGAVDTHFHKYNYVIEFDTESGAVYGVWYWEKEDGFEYTKDAKTDNQKKEARLKNNLMVGFYGGDQIDRLQFSHLPYPSVQLINAEELRLEITVPNIEKATGDFTITVSADDVVLLEDAKLKKNNMGTVVLDTLKVTNAYSASLTEARNNARTASDWVVGMKYKKWREALGELPLPGDDITLTVKMSYTGEIDGKSLTPSTLVVTGNTLFEKVEEDSTGDKTAYIAYGRHLQNLHDSGPTSTTDGIACSGVLDNVSIKKAEQTKNINFAFLNNTGDNNNDVYYWASIYGRTAAGTHDEKYISLHPIYNKNLTFYDGHGFEIRNMDTGRNYYGGMFSYIVGGTYQNIVLVNPHIHSDFTKTDLGSTVDKQLTAGALVAMVKGEVKITNCHVYNEYVEDKDKNVKPEGDYAENPWFGATGFNLNGLKIKDSSGDAVQYKDTNGDGIVDEIVPIEGLYVERLQEMPHIGAPGAGSMSGGLIGEIQSGSTVTITGSSAAVINIGAKAVGGLVGKSAGNLTIDKSYSASFVFGNRNVAGLVGFVEDTTANTTTITNSYAAGEIVSGYDKGFKGAGLLHYNEEATTETTPTNIKVENCYAAVRYNGEGVDGLPRRDDQEKRDNKFYVVGYIYGTFKGDNSNLYVKQNGISYGYDIKGITVTGGKGGEYITDKGDASACGTPITTAELTAKVTSGFGGEWSTTPGTTANTHAYTLLTETKALEGEAYPYPMLNVTKNGVTTVMPHYGDWLEEDPTAASLCYYEKYEGDTFGVWGYVTDKTTDNQIPLNSLKPGDPGKGPYAIADGYCVAVEDGANLIPPETITVGSETYNVDRTSIGTTDNAGKTYNLYRITGLDGITVGTDYYYTATVSGQDYWFNPFFACEVLEADGTMPTAPQAKEGAKGKDDNTSTAGVVIRTARQLANLASQTGSTLKADNPAQLRAYTQLLDIDYEQYETSIKGQSGGTDAQSPAALSGAGSYNGNSFIIKNLFIQGDSKTGLFGELSLSGTQGVRNVFLVDVTVNGTGSNVGALVGSAAGSTVIDNCGVYASSAENYKTHSVTGNTTVGGLIGMAGSTTVIKNSFAAVQVKGDTAVGGFVGQINGNKSSGSLENCYSGGFTESGKYEASSANVTANDTNGIAGGFVGKLMNYSNDNGGNPTYNGLKFQGTIYTTCSVKGATVGLFSGQNSEGAGTGQQTIEDALTATGLTLYATGKAFNADGTDATARPETYLKTGSDVPKAVGTGVTAYPYDGTLKDPGLDTGTYPYLTNLDEHHGDWADVSEPVPEMMLAYIEEYVGVTDPGVYMVNYNGTVADDVQHNIQFGAVVKNDYYRILSTIDLRTGSSVTDITLDGTPFTTGDLVSQGTVKIGTTDYYAYTLGADWDSAANYYHKVELKLATGETKTYLYNPSFACEAFDVTDAAGTVTTTDILPKPNAGGTITYTNTDVLIRSARQLANVQAYTNHTTYGATAQEWTYDQLLNVDFDGYTGTLAGGKSDSDRLGPAKLTTGTYNGNDLTISNLYLGAGTIGSDAYAGLFGTVNGTVSHVLLVDVNVNGDATGVSALAVGGLVGQLNGGSVDNCGIYVSNKDNYGKFTVSGSGGNGVGGLIGQMTGGAVTNSFAAVMVRGTDATNGGTGGTTLTNPAGGFVGQANGGEFKNCYVGGFVGASKTYDDASINVMGNNRVGGFVGSISGTVKFTGTNYSTASVGGPDPANLGLFAGNGTPSGTGSTLYAVAKAFKSTTTGTSTTYDDVVAPRDETAYLTSAPEATTVTTTNVYNQTGDFPYASGQTEHHGDWIGLTKGVYYDTVVQNAGTSPSPITGYYANGASGLDGSTGRLAAGNANDELLDYATDDGYMFLSETDLGEKVALGINGASFPMSRVRLTTELDGNQYAYYVPADALNTMPTDGYYFTVTVNGQFFTANFAFAGEIFDGKDVDHSKPAKKDLLTTAGVMIRTPRQLANLGIATNNGTEAGKALRGLKYVQLLDLDYREGKYDKTKMPTITDKAGKEYNHVPITLDGPDAGYNGSGYTVRGLLPGTLVDGEFAENGMFGSVKNGATLENITLVNARVVTDNDVNNAVMNNGTPSASSSSGTLRVLGDDNLTARKATTNENFTCSDGDFNFNIYLQKDSEILDSGNKTINGTTAKKYVKFKGSAKISNGELIDGIVFTTNYKASVNVWWTDPSKTDVRQVRINSYDFSKKELTEVETSTNGVVNDQIVHSTFELSYAGTFCIGSKSSGINIYRIEITEYTPAGPGTTPPVAANTPTGTTIPTTARVRAGALAGIVDGATVTNCGAYIEAETGTGATYKTADEAYNSCLVKNGYKNSSEDNVGGLIGAVENSTVTSSFSAVKVQGMNFVGGFAGKLGGDGETTIENCYSGGHTHNGSYYDDDGAMTNVRADGENTGAGGFAGLVSKSGTVVFKGVNYTTSSVGLNGKATVTAVSNPENDKDTNDPQVNNVETGTTIGAFFGRVEYVKNHTNIVTTGAINYATGTLFSNGSAIKRNATASTTNGYRWDTDKWIKATSEKKASVQYVTADESFTNALVTMLDPRTSGGDAPYDSLGDTYPYMAAKAADGTTELKHHGDWTNRLDFIYYEVYDEDHKVDMDAIANDKTVKDDNLVKLINDEKIGFYGELRGTGVINTLRDDTVVYDSGYMVVSDADIGPVDIQLRTEYTKEGENNPNHYNQGTILNIKDVRDAGIGDGVDYVYIVPHSVLNIAPSDHYYMLAYVNGVTYVFNPHFAGEAINVDLIDLDGVKNNTIDLDKVRVKKGLEYVDAAGVNHDDVNGVAIRSAWNFASIARYSRSSNNGAIKTTIRQMTFYQLMDIDYTEYKQGKIYDGNDNNRVKVGGENKDKSGSSFIYGNVPIILDHGTYEGNGHTIKNVYLSNDSGNDNNCVGLFGTLTDGSKVRNLTAENIYLTTGSSNGSAPIYMGVIAASVDGGSTIENVKVLSPTFDLHRVPVLKETKNSSGDKVYEWTYDSAQANVSAIGGIVGKLINGSVTGSATEPSVVNISINLDSGRYYYLGTDDKDENTARNSLEEYDTKKSTTKPADAHQAKSVVKDNTPINIGGAIGEIDASASGASVSVKNVYVVNPSINANNEIDSGNGNIVGGVIGKADGGEYVQGSFDPTTSRNITIENAGTYVDGSKAVPATDNHTAYNTFTVEANGAGTDDLTGGFAGRTDPFVKLIKCFAAVKVEGGEYVGGFVGDLQGSYIEDCYSGGHTKDGEYKDPANVKGSGDVTGGFAGKIENTTDNSLVLKGTIYTTSSVSGTGKVGLFQSGEDNKNAVKNAMDAGGATLYATGEVISGTHIDESNYLLTGSSIPRQDNTDPTKFTTSPYEDELITSKAVFPYQTNLPEHHGDWIDVNSAGAFYYELEGGAYHFYTVDSAGKIANGLTDETNGARAGQEITQWGYGYYYADGTTDPAIAGATEAAAGLVNALGKTGCKVMVVNNGTSTANADQTWTIGGKTFTVNTAYAAAIAVDTGTSAPYQIRTKGQLANIGDSNSESFVQTHDIVFSSDNTPINTFQGNYNGGFYRILNITAPVFDTLVGSANIHNVIVYAPQGYGSKTITGQGGIANTSTGNVTIENTIAAGFTIGQGDNAGGLVGSVGGGTLTITNCEATNTLKGANAGGLVGLVGSGGTLTITNSYAGGSITGSATSAGGLVGSGTAASITYTDVYAYVDMTALTGTPTIYGIGPGATGGDGLYWKDRLPSGASVSDDSSNAVELNGLNGTGGAGEYIAPDSTDFDKGLTPQTEPFPFVAVVTDGTKTYHYGAVPTINTTKAAGLFYWEKEVIDGVEQYHIYAYGGEIDDSGGTLAVESAKLLADTLCHSHHLDGERASIVDSGYGVFYSGDVRDLKLSTKDGPIYDVTSLDKVDSVVENELLSAAKLVDGTNVYMLPESANSGKDDTWTLGKLDSSNKNKDIGLGNIEVCQLYGAAIDKKFGNGGDGGIGSDVANIPVQIRTIDQLQNIKDLNNSTSIEYFAITHDLDGTALTSDYEPVTLKINVFNGGGYRIFDLNINPSSGDAALFNETNGKTIKNVILYSTDGNGEITSNNGNAGGIVATLGNATIENCVVAGYTISGTKYVGGIAGEANNSNAKIISCAFVGNLIGTSANGIGGIAGLMTANYNNSGSSGNDGYLRNCYAGGTITGNATHIGGIFGEGNLKNENSGDVRISGCYTYMDMSGASGTNVYTIGNVDATNTRLFDAGTCYYLDDSNRIPTGATQQGTGKSYDDLKTALSGDSIGTATSSYVPNGKPAGSTNSADGMKAQTTNFPFPAVVREVNSDGSYTATYVHYGEWPADPAGGPAGDPGIPEGPGVISAPLEALVPPALKLPDETQEADPEDDSHTEVVRRRVQTALVRRAKKRTQEV